MTDTKNEKKEASDDTTNTVVKKTKSSSKKTVTKSKSQSKAKKIDEYYATGKRKCAIAKVWLRNGNGKFIVNKKEGKEYFHNEGVYEDILKPIKKLKLDAKYDITVSTIGGGLIGQAGACQLGIARALENMNGEFRNSLKVEGFLSRDPRVKERKKYGCKKARKGFTYRKR